MKMELSYYKKHKIYLIQRGLLMSLILPLKRRVTLSLINKGEEVISEKHDKDFDSRKRETKS